MECSNTKNILFKGIKHPSVQKFFVSAPDVSGYILLISRHGNGIKRAKSLGIPHLVQMYASLCIEMCTCHLYVLDNARVLRFLIQEYEYCVDP